MRNYYQQRTIIQLWVLSLLTVWGCDQNLSEELNKATEPVNMQVPEFKGTLIAESGSSTGARQAESRLTPLDELFTSYQVYSLQTTSLSSYARTNPYGAFKLNLSKDYTWDITLEPSNLIAPNYESIVDTETGLVAGSAPEGLFFKGTTSDGGRIRLNLKGERMNGFISYEDETLYIENASDLGVESNDLVIYRAGDVLSTEGVSCLANDVSNYSTDHIEKNTRVTSDDCGGQYILKIATYATYAFYEGKFYEGNNNSDITRTNQTILEVLNLSQANFEEFNIKFQVVEQRVATCETCLPFSITPRMVNVKNLEAFTDWASDNFRNNHDVGILFMGYKLTPNAGLAYVDKICKDMPYAIVSHSSFSGMRAITSHEIGHTFGSSHDDSTPNIMNTIGHPALNNWTSNTKNIINGRKQRGCLCDFYSGWLLYSGGTSEAEIINTSASVASKVKIGDFNGDGEDDVIRLLDHSTQGLGWYIKYSGRGAWVKVFTSGAAMDKVSIGDFDGDGEDDVITVFGTGMPDGPGWYVSYSAKTIWFKINDTVSASPAFRVGDFNGDGVSDLIQRFNYEELSEGSLKGYHISYGNFGRNAHKEWERVNGITWGLDNTFIGDFDGDGKDDIFTKVTLHWNVMYAASGFQSWVKMKESNYDVDRLKIGDFNGDGQADLMTFRGSGSSTGRGWAVVYSGLGKWTRINDATELNSNLDKLKVGDFDGDDTSDILYFNND